MGSDQWVDLTICDDSDQAFDTLKAKGMTIYDAHLSEQAIDFRLRSTSRNPALF